MLIIAVERKGKYTDTYAARFLCYDAATRMAYLSDTGKKIHQWKHRLQLYGILPKVMQLELPPSYRVWNYNAKELLSFTLSGVSHHRLDGGSGAADADEVARLPKLTDELCASLLSPAVVDEQQHQEQLQQLGVTQVSSSAVVSSDSTVDAAAFFGHGREDWQLRSLSFTSMGEMLALMINSLAVAGLRRPMHGGLTSAFDPRNGLPLAVFPLYVQVEFHLLAGAVVYSCIHGRMVGCSEEGELGICLRHTYLCITDQDVLLVTESGRVGRLIPLCMLEKVEYNAPALPTDERNANTNAAATMPYIAFLTSDDAADVLFSPCSAFSTESNDSSASMVETMPRMNVSAVLKTVAAILTTLAKQTRGPVSCATASKTEIAATGDEKTSEEAQQRMHRARAALAAPAVLPPSFEAVELPSSQTMQSYAASFTASHQRAFKWQPLASWHHPPPRVQTAALLAASLGLPAPKRAEISRRPEFQIFYFGGTLAAEAAAEQWRQRKPCSPTTAARRGGSGIDGEDGAVEEHYVSPVPVRRVSKLLNAFAVEQSIY